MDDNGPGRAAADVRAKAALRILTKCGGFDGDHHKAWAIDQAVRALCGVQDGPHGYPGEAVNDEYLRHVYESCKGEDGDWTYSWETGVAP
jgi:hypothetical protein